MACRYFLGDKELKGDELTSYMKRLPHEEKLKVAPEIAKDSYQRLSWTPGEAQAARYDLSKQVDQLLLDPKKDGSFKLIGRKDGNNAIEQDVTADKLPDIVGKEAAKNLLTAEKNKFGMHELSGQQLKIGGEGMKGFYDQIIPKALEKLGKEHGVKVKQAPASDAPKYTTKTFDRSDNGKEIVSVYKDGKFMADMEKSEAEHYIKTKSASDKPDNVHYIDIPQSLKDSAMHKGFPLFSSTHMFTPISHDPFEKKK